MMMSCAIILRTVPSDEHSQPESYISNLSLLRSMSVLLGYFRRPKHALGIQSKLSKGVALLYQTLDMIYGSWFLQATSSLISFRVGDPWFKLPLPTFSTFIFLGSRLGLKFTDEILLLVHTWLPYWDAREVFLMG